MRLPLLVRFHRPVKMCEGARHSFPSPHLPAGPSPLAAPRSWDKSPVANGAHYFLYGKIDAQTPGVLQVERTPS